MKLEIVSIVVRMDTRVVIVVLLANQTVKGGEEMTVVDQEEVDVRDIGLAKKRMWQQEEGLFDKVEFITKELEELKKKTESTLDKGQGDSTFGDFAHFLYATTNDISTLDS
jgi:hypothetical protein